MSCGPWKLFRFILRVTFFGVLAWFILALLWAFLPSPPSDHNPDNGSLYPTSQLRAGKALTRVYASNHFRIEDNYRSGFAIDYRLDMDTLMLTISGAERQLPIFLPAFNDDQTTNSVTEQVNVTARIGDRDGANLPWFEFADAVLLYWWIEKDILPFTVDVTWTMGGTDSCRRMVVQVAGYPHRRPLLALEMQGSDVSSLVIETPERPESFSPSKTYPVRVALILVIAPTAVFVNDLLGGFVGQLIESVVTTLLVLFAVLAYGFAFMAIFFSVWGCVRGPSFEATVERTQARLDRLRQHERLQFLRIQAFQKRLDQICDNERFKSVLEICRNGWHPERDAARQVEVEIDVQKEAAPKKELD
ncbi:hypothetical protein NA56DRAFT_650465 [Hyaloscypha hepaticicola]|uniref:Uncharacterized protein n=1 Tax=Hyaloscypha hepaticicola TaxID=2082293 RepID=A0A2J6PLY5_9HELO|nr:hypothetical protein NA56DRAFT_650465 [Hyaloscypha hepaticicola]